MNALEVRDLTKHYKNFTLDRISFDLPMGSVLGLIGENGAGKSTTLKLILEIAKKDGGAVSVLGSKPGERLPKERIGVVMDEVGIHGCLSARDLGRILSGVYPNWDRAAYDAYLKRMDLDPKKQFKSYSRGMKMKLGIAAALSHDPQLLILDEATSGLDPVIRDEVTDLFSEFTRDENRAVLISSHIVSDLEKICDYIAFLHKGRLLLFEEKDRLKERCGLLQCTAEELSTLPAGAVLGRKVTPYGVQALVDRGDVPAGLHISPVDLEQIFIFMVKEAQPNAWPTV